MTSNSQKARRWLVIFFLLAAISDLVSFLAFRQYHIFEINPIYILSKSVLLMIALKLTFMLLGSWLLLNGFESRHMNFALVLASCYAILFQFLGCYSNLHVAYTAPSPEQALTPVRAMSTYTTLMLTGYFVPLIMGWLAYFIFDICGYDSRTRDPEATKHV